MINVSVYSEANGYSIGFRTELVCFINIVEWINFNFDLLDNFWYDI
jgi:hypothetical protein